MAAAQFLQQPQGCTISGVVFAQQEVVRGLTQPRQGFFGGMSVVQPHTPISRPSQKVEEIAEVIVVAHHQQLHGGTVGYSFSYTFHGGPSLRLLATSEAGDGNNARSGTAQKRRSVGMSTWDECSFRKGTQKDGFDHIGCSTVPKTGSHLDCWVCRLVKDYGSYLLSGPRLRLRSRGCGRRCSQSSSPTFDSGICARWISDRALYPGPDALRSASVRSAGRDWRHPADVFDRAGVFNRRTFGSEVGGNSGRPAGYPVFGRPGRGYRMVAGLGYEPGNCRGRDSFRRQHHGAFPVA